MAVAIAETTYCIIVYTECTLYIIQYNWSHHPEQPKGERQRNTTQQIFGLEKC